MDKKGLLVFLCSAMLVTSACSQKQIKKEIQQTAKDNTKEVVSEAKAPEMIKATPDELKKVVFQSLGFNAVQGEKKVSDIVINQNDDIIIKFIPDANGGGNLLAFSIQRDITNILWGIKKSHMIANSVQLIVNQPSIEQSGNSSQKEIVNVTYNNKSLNTINYESINTDLILSMADTTTYLEPSLVRK